DPIYRKYDHNKLTFYPSYMFSEKYMLAFSHDEVKCLKRSFKEKMPGDEWQQSANLRLLFAFLFTMPGNKFAFMGGEIGVFKEWNPDESLDWWLLEYPLHKGVQNLVRVLNRLYRNEPALHQLDFDPRGFHWIDCSDREKSIIIFIRRGRNPADDIVVIFNKTPEPRYNYRVGLPYAGYWQEIFNSDASCYGGSNVGNHGGVSAQNISWHNQPHSAEFTLPPLGCLMFKRSSSAVEDVTDSLNIIKGLIKLDELVEKKHREIPENEKIYMRIFGPSLSFKTDLAMFIQRCGIGGIDTKNIVWVETDELHKKHYFYPYIDEEKVKRIVPREIAQLSVGKRLVILEGIYSALFHPSGEWYFYKDNAPSMDIEVAVECSRHIRQARAIRRDGSTVRLDTGDEHLADWMTAIDGRDVRINTDLAEEIEALERLVYESKPLLKYKERLVPLLEHFIEFAKEQKEYFEKQSKKGFSAGSPLAFKHEQQITLIKFKHHIKIQKATNASSSVNREYLSQLPREHISGKIFLVRVDYNDQHWDPSTGALVDARRFRASLSTIIFIVENGGKVILVTHQGRPQGRVIDDLRLNRARLTISGLLGEPVRLLEGKEDNDGRFRLITDEVKNRVKAMRSSVAMLDNTRFDQREQSKNIDERMSLAKELQSLADYFVLDGFPVAHRDETSVTEIAKLLPGVKGYWVRNEERLHTTFMKKIKNSNRGKLVAIFGGEKEDKLAVIEKFIPLMRKGDSVLIAGKIQKAIPPSLRNTISLSGIDMLLPVDSAGNEQDIGPRAITQFKNVLDGAELVFWNGPLGEFENIPYNRGTKEVAAALNRKACRLENFQAFITGGETSFAVTREIGSSLSKRIIISTGGGTSTDFFANNGKLIGFKYLRCSSALSLHIEHKI
ncbi:MAG TPA: hypothetical protein DCL49_08370, partial [Candidatus Omnitrophica bacterium]|nr:hypothetical protein [Candidatus Omnitrophota bacterium]